MRWFRALIICCYLLVLLPNGVAAAPSRQSIGCDAGAIAAQFPWLRDWLAYLPMPYAQPLPVTVEGQSLTLQVCAAQNQSVEANHLLGVLKDSLPLLSSAAGVPLGGGGFQRPILIVDDDALPSANGMYGEDGIIYLRQAIADRTVIHEGAHYWANEHNLRDLWMIEGYADYLTELVMGQPRESTLRSSTCDDVVLLYWRYQPQTTMHCGYLGGAAVFRDLAAQLGVEPLRDALRSIRAHFGPIDSWQLLTGLEASACQDLTPIFLEHHVFPLGYELERRAQQRSELCQLQQLAEALEVILPGHIEQDINARDYDAAERWLSPLPAFLEAAAAVAQRCDGLGLPCDRPWLPVPQDPEALVPITARLVAAQPLLDGYRQLRDAAQALKLAPPAGLTQAAIALDASAEPQMRQALAALEGGDRLEQQCSKLRAPCLAGWREQWRGGNIALALDQIADQTAVLSQSVQVEARCSLILDACRAVWHPYLSAGQFVESRTALNKLANLLDTAVAVEQRCADVVKTCRDSWQAALRGERLPGLELRLGAIDNIVAQAKQQEVDKLCAGWNCAQAWRAVFGKSGDPQLVRGFLDEAQVALPTLQRAASAAESASHADLALIWLPAGPAAPMLLEQAHGAFEQGDVARARALADQSLAMASTPRLNWLAARTPYGIALATLLLAGIFAVAVRRKPRRARRAAADQALLAELLSQPAEANPQQSTTNIKKAA